MAILQAYQRIFRDTSRYDLHTLEDPTQINYDNAMAMDVIISDQRMPNILGTDIFHRLHSMGYQGRKIICSGFSDFDDITTAFNDQAINHFINKPWDNDELRNLVNTQISHSAQTPPNTDHSQAMVAAYEQAAKAAKSDVAVYIQGETGSGKEVMTQFIHNNSPRKDGPLVTVNCATLTPELFESLMFGHKKGAFTGAVNDHKGFFEAAHGGTLFLDEVVDIPQTAQAKILRALQEHTVTPLGDTRDIKVDVRVISASAKPIQQAVQEKLFRDDLMYRLNIFPIRIPPLRERQNEITPLFETFLSKFNFHKDWPNIRYDKQVVNALLAYPWPGNIRELSNLCHYLCASLDEPVITLGLLPDHYQQHNQTPQQHATPIELTPPDIAEMTISEALALSANNKSKAAKLLGISRMTLWRKLQQESK